eukprot:7200726-Lingulodinium_polyedra.AAC.1
MALFCRRNGTSYLYGPLLRPCANRTRFRQTGITPPRCARGRDDMANVTLVMVRSSWHRAALSCTSVNSA